MEPAKEARGAIPAGVILAAVAAGVGFMPGVGAFDEPVEPGELMALGWPGFGAVAALMLDRDPGSRLGRVLAGTAVVPMIVIVTAALVPLEGGVETRVGTVWRTMGIVPLLATIAVIGWALGVAPDRLSRRRMTWFGVWAGVVVAAVVVSYQVSSQMGAAATMMIGLWALICSLTLLCTARELRPIDEPLLDAAAAVGVLAVAATAGLLMRWAGRHGHIPSPDVTGGLVAAIAGAFAVPGAWWARNRYLERRYGTGELSSVGLAALTTGLSAEGDPRHLLTQAAAMVAAASGHLGATITLGDDEPDVPEHWVIHPLVVGDDRVGTLALDPLHKEGSEPRQRRIVAQLLPTVSLATRAVVLAVGAEHSRQDLVRERDAERARILADLHDGLGPVLAGLRMRLQARLRAEPSEWLEEAVDDLAGIRDELRLLVQGLTPAVLDDGDLTGALTGLVDSFRAGGAVVTLDFSLDVLPHHEAAVAIYRFVAEGITNAIRHACATGIAVRVGDGSIGIEVSVADDGCGGVFAPGVGLTSLRKRADGLGGSLSIERAEPKGTLLKMALPA